MSRTEKNKIEYIDKILGNEFGRIDKQIFWRVLFFTRY